MAWLEEDWNCGIDERNQTVVQFLPCRKPTVANGLQNIANAC
jgi:hypothetical protein